MFRSYKIDVDGVRRGALKRGEELRLNVTPGQHLVRASIDWAGSPEVGVQVSAGEEQVLEVTGVGGRKGALAADAKTSYLTLAPIRGSREG